MMENIKTGDMVTYVSWGKVKQGVVRYVNSESRYVTTHENKIVSFDSIEHIRERVEQ